MLCKSSEIEMIKKVFCVIDSLWTKSEVLAKSYPMSVGGSRKKE